jgi:hypothetical protein
VFNSVEVKYIQETQIVMFQNYLPRSALGNTNGLRTYNASPASQTEIFSIRRVIWIGNLMMYEAGISWSTSDRFLNKK